MWIIRKDGVSVRELSLEERALLHGFSAGTLARREEELASRILRSVRSDGCWLSCDCIRPMPVMNVALRDTGTLVLRNNPGGSPHAANCPLIKQDSGHDDSERKKQPELVRISPDFPITLHVEFSGAEPRESPQISRSDASKTAWSQKKRILSLLFSLIESAGLHEYDPALPKTVTEQYARLREVAGRYRLANSVPLLGYFGSHISKKHLYEMALRLKSASQFGKYRRTGLLLDLVEGVSGRTIKLLDDKELGFFSHSEKSGTASGPLMALATVTTQAHNSGFYELGTVAALPVLSRRNLLPVAADCERSPLEEILPLLDWLLKKHSRRVVLRREMLNGGNEVELIGRDRIVRLDLTGETLASKTEHPGDGILLTLADQPIDIFKKRIVRAFLSELDAKHEF
ncbi:MULTISPECIES: hypothetical protein [Ectopseudomonas]|jgi:hypothetical protein|uniref:Uncharacterized protein n=2 Tax=Ectopseudomonas TaxID=3236654 RepID=A0A1G6Q703_9GAMM|nr:MULTISPECIES: hypothetical protein [Pseudomonas]ALN21708.1 hypothetical protein DW68_023795 [Pseudomonas mendocina S5.2]KER98225.1 hypothetical protein HN51_25940 [Pseudomonas mendocina]MBP3062120.1 hypothetical protein [Pseudomonas chengduensis]NNB75412.1 hypothetical protein [Pseudomonas chengduensis]CRN64649.1 hypothetical protein PAERUG_P40_Scotland_4_VIM_2_09_12_04015 [Pseudomonas aeruginosa]